jgi:hypothetical protein
LARIQLNDLCQVGGLNDDVDAALVEQVPGEFAARNHIYTIEPIHHDQYLAMLHLDSPENLKDLFLLNG